MKRLSIILILLLVSMPAFAGSRYFSGIADISDAGDVTITSGITNDTLQYNGSVWENRADILTNSITTGYGSVANPSIVIEGVNGGFYNSAANTIGVVLDSAKSFDIGSINMSAVDSGAFLIRIRGASAEVPTYAHVGDSDTGRWRSAANTLEWVSGGVEVFSITNATELPVDTIITVEGSIVAANTVTATPSIGEMFEASSSHHFIANTYTSDLGSGATLTETSGTLVNTATINDIAHELTEINSTPSAAIYTFNTTGAALPAKVNVRLDYNGNHDMKIQLLNYNTPGYDDMTGETTDFGKGMTTFDTYAFYLDPAILGEPKSSYINGSGQVTVRIDHPNNGVNSHIIKVDHVSVEKATLSLDIAGTEYLLIGLMEGISTPGVTVDAANAKFTFTIPGKYDITGSFSLESLGGSHVNGGMYQNDVLQDKGTFFRGFVENNATGVAMGHAFINASINDEIRFKFWSDVDNNYIILHHADITAHRLN